jgi:cytochrome c551/c552
MMIHVRRDGEQFGPYTLEDANAYLAQGSLLPSDQAWYEGAPDWLPIIEVPGIQWEGASMVAPSVAATVAATGGKTETLMYAGIVAVALAVFGVVGWGYPGVFKKKDSSASMDADSSGNKKGAAVSTPSALGSTSFAKTAEPVFRKYGCFDCHSSKESNKVEADFDLSDRTTWRAFLSPNQEGNPATAPLVLAITATAANGKPMPPKGPRVSDAEVETIKKWIVAEWEM